MWQRARASTIPTTVAREESAGGVAVLYLRGRLRWPVSPELRQRVEVLLARGERAILLDLANVTAIDAAGVGELVQLYGLADATDGALWIDNANDTVSTLLERAGLLELLSLDSVFACEKCS
jgi:anti-anti-sigma factor